MHEHMHETKFFQQRSTESPPRSRSPCSYSVRQPCVLSPPISVRADVSMHAHALQHHMKDLTVIAEPLDSTREDLGVLAGEPLRTMTLHYRVLKHVDGSLIADDANGEVRWIQKVLSPPKWHLKLGVYACTLHAVGPRIIVALQIFVSLPRHPTNIPPTPSNEVQLLQSLAVLR